jgi:hypothetical protein
MNYFQGKDSVIRKEVGIAVLETSLILSILLPFFLMLTVVCSYLHELQTSVNIIDTLLRELETNDYSATEQSILSTSIRKGFSSNQGNELTNTYFEFFIFETRFESQRGDYRLRKISEVSINTSYQESNRIGSEASPQLDNYINVMNRNSQDKRFYFTGNSEEGETGAYHMERIGLLRMKRTLKSQLSKLYGLLGLQEFVFEERVFTIRGVKNHEVF